jgi:allophanate hydrolase subunit 1
VRGAFKGLAGVGQVDAKIGDRNLVVHYDSKAVTVDQMIAALAAAKEPAVAKAAAEATK